MLDVIGIVVKKNAIPVSTSGSWICAQKSFTDSLRTQLLHMHSSYRKMCFKYKQVSLNKHLEFNSAQN